MNQQNYLSIFTFYLAMNMAYLDLSSEDSWDEYCTDSGDFEEFYEEFYEAKEEEFDDEDMDEMDEMKEWEMDMEMLGKLGKLGFSREVAGKAWSMCGGNVEHVWRQCGACVAAMWSML
ncbi:unnamed protein product [Blepharisma stoltei]|uniref:Uncharacterized protein n=1 Tax=Blepharisma stoltei TaxID=1481888 RepID=A0AAU9J249_9CILI|nr:unnamed protein product [Blepharisma stoltei]